MMQQASVRFSWETRDYLQQKETKKRTLRELRDLCQKPGVYDSYRTFCDLLKMVGHNLFRALPLVTVGSALAILHTAHKMLSHTLTCSELQFSPDWNSIGSGVTRTWICTLRKTYVSPKSKHTFGYFNTQAKHTDEEEMFLDPEWEHLHLAYEILLRIVSLHTSGAWPPQPKIAQFHTQYTHASSTPPRTSKMPSRKKQLLKSSWLN